MGSAIIFLIIIIAAILLIPLILAIGTRSRIVDLADQIRNLENKLDLLIRSTKEAKEQVLQKSQPVKEVIITREPVKIIVPEPVFTPPPPTPIPEEVLTPVHEYIFETPVENTIKEPEVFTEKISTTIPSETFWEKFNRKNPDLEKFVGENLINKIGIAVLVLGIAFFVKYAIDKEWINEYARVGIGVLAGGIVLLFAHKLRAKFKAFSSVLVAGAIAIFYFTITIGFQDYHIFSQPVAFAIMVGITAFSVLISLLYDREELALLSLIGGFAAPFMISTGEGNYKVLFTYILILDIGMLILSLVRNWKRVHLLSYLFTILLYGGWFFSKVIYETNAPYFGALVFASLFYFTFFSMVLVNNIKTGKQFLPVDLFIILTLNFLFCGVGLYILDQIHENWKGAFIASLAIFNFIASMLLHKQFKADKNLIYLLIGLTLSYATLAAPVQLHGNYITLFWAAEAVLLLWLGQRSEIKIFRIASILVNLLMLSSLVMDWQKIYNMPSIESLPIIINKAFITSIICLSSIISLIYLLRNEELEYRFLDFAYNSKIYRSILTVIAFIAGYLSGFLELNAQLNLHAGNSTVLRSGLGCYHLIFSAFIIHFFIQGKSASAYLFPAVLGFGNFALYFLNINNLPFEGLRNSIIYNSENGTVFLLHYFSLIAFIYGSILILYHIVKGENFESSTKNLCYGLFAFIVVFTSSSELLLHVVNFSGYEKQTLVDGVLVPFLGFYYKMRDQVIKTGFPILWGIIAFVLVAVGMRKQIKAFRVLSLTLLAITIVKLFSYDIQNVSDAGKIIAFILLGILLLVTSFMYQKIKAIFLDDEK